MVLGVAAAAATPKTTEVPKTINISPGLLPGAKITNSYYLLSDILQADALLFHHEAHRVEVLIVDQ